MWIFWTLLKELSRKLKRNHLTLQYIFLTLLFKKTKKLEKPHADTNSRLLKTFVNKINTGLFDNENLKKYHLGIKKFHLNMKGNILFAKNLLNFIEGSWNFRSERDIFKEESGASHEFWNQTLKSLLRISAVVLSTNWYSKK